MKPRTRNQKEVELLRMKLPPISEKQKEWAVEHCFEDIGYVCKGEVWCSHCGRTHINPIPELGVALKTETETKCPYCYKKLRLKNSRAKKKEIRSAMTIVTVRGGWQVLRHVEIIKYLYKITSAVNVDCMSIYMNEVVQQWVNERGECVVVARPRNYNCGNYSWDRCGELSIRDISRLYTYEQEMYNMLGEVYTYKKVIPILKRNGYDGYVPRSISMCDLFVKILQRNEAETLIKAKQYELLEWFGRKGLTAWIWPSVRIAIRNRYKVKEAAIWYDMLDALMYLGKDLRNSYYVCPKNLHEAHDKWIALKEKEKQKRKKEAEQRKIKNWEDTYQKEKSKFFGVVICEEGITIRPIMSVGEMMDEGKSMHHCVFTNEYFKKKDSLILSAKDSEGHRLETIEVLLSKGIVNQCFGAFNKFTEHHERILRMMKENMNMIMKAV